MKSSLTLPTVLLGGALSLGGCAMSSGPYVVSAEADRRCSTTERLVDGVLTVTGDTCRETRERRTVGWVGGYQERATIVETCTVYRERIDGALRETRRECTEKERVRTDDGYRGGYTYSTRR